MKNTRLLLIGLVVIVLTACFPETTGTTLEGEWSCEETSEIYMQGEQGVQGELGMKGMMGTTVFPVYIAQDAMNANKYYIDNFYNMGSGSQVTVTLLGRSLNISTQKVQGIDFVGSGTVSADENTIELAYTADDGGGDIDHVTAIYTR